MNNYQLKPNGLKKKKTVYEMNMDYGEHNFTIQGQ